MSLLSEVTVPFHPPDPVFVGGPLRPQSEVLEGHPFSDRLYTRHETLLSWSLSSVHPRGRLTGLFPVKDSVPTSSDFRDADVGGRVVSVAGSEHPFWSGTRGDRLAPDVRLGEVSQAVPDVPSSVAGEAPLVSTGSGDGVGVPRSVLSVPSPGVGGCTGRAPRCRSVPYRDSSRRARKGRSRPGLGVGVRVGFRGQESVPGVRDGVHRVGTTDEGPPGWRQGQSGDWGDDPVGRSLVTRDTGGYPKLQGWGTAGRPLRATLAPPSWSYPVPCLG